MQTMKASEFKAKCLALMDQVNETGDEIIITKNGKPVSVLKAYKKIPKTLFGRSKGKIKMMDDLIEPVGEKWDAE
ncbi:MAG: type II toxin-antitoxin system Phd/YefM family antitoxin [Thermodesulfobacteriota bacterium]|nr:type II toxin-antitoxin system Phd/YefM family antitoxin [Thermodesulfobacteriota bacterium]